MAKSREEKPRPHRGGILVYMMMTMTVLMGICSLAVDLGRVQVAKTELRRAADAAARAAAYNLPSGTTAAQNAAISYAAQNSVDGTPLVLQTGDVVVGQWNSSTQTLNTSSSTPDTVQITAHRDSSRSNPIQLIWGQVIGYGSCNLEVVSAAQNPSSTGLLGLSYITIHNNLFVASYNSSVTTTPSHTSYLANGLVESNGAISAPGGGGNTFEGSVVLGPSGSVNTVTVTGSTTTGSTIATPTTPAMNSVVNPGGVSVSPNLTGTNTYTWPGGTYYFTGLTIANQVTINFSGPATLYINGNVSIQDQDTITAYNSVPGNLVVYQASGDTFSVHDNGSYCWDYNAPGVNLLFHDSDNIYGAMIGASITVHDNDSIYLDQSLQSGTGGGGGIVLVQ